MGFISETSRANLCKSFLKNITNDLFCCCIESNMTSCQLKFSATIKVYIYIYQTLLSKTTYIAFKLQFYILSALAFPGNRTHDVGVASAMLYHLSYRKALYAFLICFPVKVIMHKRFICMHLYKQKPSWLASNADHTSRARIHRNYTWFFFLLCFNNAAN